MDCPNHFLLFPTFRFTENQRKQVWTPFYKITVLILRCVEDQIVTKSTIYDSTEFVLHLLCISVFLALPVWAQTYGCDVIVCCRGENE